MGFEKIIGYDGIKKELAIIADILRNPEKYDKLGAKPPKGMLFYGEPGLGKTLCAECFIRETKRFAVICRKDSGNADFIKSINEAFDSAMEHAPSVLFFDDLDKASNNDSMHVNSDEFAAMQTRIDSLKGSDVFVLATINSDRNLPCSLVRTGRFDRKFEFKIPDDKDARAIMKRYMSDKSIEKGIEEDIYRMMSGHSCSDLETVINTAAIFAVYDNRKLINLEDAKNAALSVLYDWNPFESSTSEKKGLEFQAYHEAGHIVVDEVLSPGIVNLAAIRPSINGKDGITVDNSLQNSIGRDQSAELNFTTGLGGMAAIRTIFGERVTGACSDIEHVYDAIYDLVTKEALYGFNCCNFQNGMSEVNYARIEDYVSAELTRYYQKAQMIIRENIGKLKNVAEALIEKKVLSASEIRALMK